MENPLRCVSKCNKAVKVLNLNLTANMAILIFALDSPIIVVQCLTCSGITEDIEYD